MTTFDQRYDAWINGRLPADEAEAFERELDERVPSDEEMRACLEDTARLSELFRGDFPAPELPNAEFLNSSLMRQIMEDQSAEESARIALQGHREKPAGLIGRLVGTFRALRAPHLALPVATMAVAAILGVSFLRPGTDPVIGAASAYAKFNEVKMMSPTKIWAGQLKHNSNVLWVNGLDWIPGDSSLN